MNGNHYLSPLLKKARLQRAFLRYLTALLLIFAGVFLVCTSGSVRGQSPTPSFAVRPNGDNVNGWDWAPDAQVTITFNDLNNGGYNATVITDGNGYFDIYVGDQFDFGPGAYIEVTDGATWKEHTVTYLEIYDVDIGTEMVYGTADSGAQVQVWVCDAVNCANRWETVDANGNWMANFSIPGDESGEEQTIDITPGAWVDSGEWDEDGDNTNAGYNVPNPNFQVQPEDDWIQGWEWDEGAIIDLSIDDPATPDNPDYTDTQVTYVPDWDPNQVVVEFNLQGQYDLKAGDFVQMTDQSTTKEYTVPHLFITSVDTDMDTVYGTADPDSQVSVWIHGDNAPGIQITADASGNWAANFSGMWDITFGTNGAAGQNDEDGDSIWVGWDVPNPVLEARRFDDRIESWGWPEGTLVTLEIDDPDTGENPDYTDTQMVFIPDWDPSQIRVEFDFYGVFDLQAGHLVTLTGSGYAKTHVLTNLSVSGVDPEFDTVSGTADPGSIVDVWMHEHDSPSLQVTADGSGHWTVDFSGLWDIGPGTAGVAVQIDDDGDQTGVNWEVPNPQFVVQLKNNNVDGWQWLPETSVTISINGTEAAIVQTDEWGNFSIHFGELAPFVSGMDFIVTDGVTTKTMTTAYLEITNVDPDSDTVSGLAGIGQVLDVWVHGENAPGVQVSANSIGQWAADFSGMWDFVPGTNGAAQVNDDDGDGTWAYWYIPNPAFAVRPFDAQVEGWEWPLGADVTMTIDDPDTSQNPDYDDIQTVVVADWDPNQTYVQFNFNYVYFIEPGHVVTLSDGATTKTHTVFDLSITSVDEIADTVSGTAVPDTQVDAWICDEWGCANRHLIADAIGNWWADFANPGPQDDEQDIYDIVPGASGDVSQSDEDGDSTQIWWNVSNPRLEVSYEHDWIQISGFTPDGQVTYTIYDYEGGHALFGPVTGPVDPHGNGWISQNLFHTDLVPGMYVTAVDETTGEEVSLLIQAVNLDYVSADDDRAFGTAEPNTTIELNISETHDDGFQLMVDVNSSGYWEVDLAAEGYPINEYRYANANLYDAEGDNVVAQNPRLHATVSTDNISVDNFSKNADVTFTLYDVPGGAILYGPQTLHTDGSGNAGVNLWEMGIDLVPGTMFTAHDHLLNFTKTLIVEPFTFDEMSAADDTVRGTAAGGEWVDLHVESLFSNWGQDALTDEAGQWFADYGSQGYDITEQMWAYGWAVDNQGNWSEDHTTGLPNIEASAAADWISGWNFSPDRPVRVQIYDSEGGSLLAEVSTMADGGTQFHMDYDQHGVDLQAGMYLFVEDLETGKTASLTLAFLTFDSVNYDADTASGQADPSAQVVIYADRLFDHFETLVTADPSGHWFADFAALGADLTPEWDLRAVVFDAELDATVANAPRPPEFTAGLDGDWIAGNNWSSNSTVQIFVYEQEGGSLIFGPFDWGTDQYGNFHANLWEQGIDLQPGNYVVVYDVAGGRQKELTLFDLAIEFVDFDLDLVGGTAPPETRLTVQFDGFEFDLFSGSDGVWLADFAVHDFDLRPGIWGNARIFDEDRDATQVDAYILNPVMQAQPDENWAEGWDWPEGTLLQLIIDDDFDPGNGILFTAQEFASAENIPPWVPAQTMAVFSLQDTFDIQPGQVLSIGDGVITKTLMITNLAITDVDANTDTVFGIAPPNSAVQVSFDIPWNWQSRDVFADENGDWSAYFGDTSDIIPGSEGSASQSDDDGDWLWVKWEILNPTILARPVEWQISGYEFPQGVDVTLTVDDPANGPGVDYTATLPAEMQDFGQTEAYFDLRGAFRIRPGHIVTMTGGEYTKTHVITNLNVTGVDPENDLVYGVADPFDTVHIFVWASPGESTANRDVTADENGVWVADFTVPVDGVTYDIEWGTFGEVLELDDDEDGTNIYWYWPPRPAYCESGDSIAGFVYEGDGTTPIAGAEVHFEDFHTGEALYYTFAGDDGRYSCDLPEGGYRVWASGGGYSREYYEEAIYEQATPVPVTTGTQNTGIDFTLDTPVMIIDFFIFNMENAFTSDIAVRQAVAYGTDRQRMIAESFPASPLLYSYLAPDHWAYAGDGLMQYSFDPNLARRILEQAGWTDEDGDGIRERDGERLSFRYVTTIVPPGHFREFIAAIFAENMADIGIEVDVQHVPEPWNEIQQDSAVGIAQFGWADDVNAEMSRDALWWVFHSEVGFNPGRYHNPTADQILNLLELFGTRAEMLPFIQQHQLAVMADLAVLPLVQRVPEEPSPLSTFVTLGAEGVYLMHGTTVVSGDVGANAAGEGPYLSDDAEVVIGTHVTFLDPASRVMGDSLRVKQGTQVYDVYHNDLDGNGDVLGQHFTPVVLPLVPAFPDVPDFTPSIQEFDVAKNDTLTLDAGRYGRLEAQKGATIIFTGGVYDFAAWDIGQDANLYFEAPTEIRIAGKLQVDKGSYVGPAPEATTLSATDIVIYVLGENGNNGQLGASPKAASFGLDNTLIANLYAPNGTLHIRQGTNATGAFLGRWVLIGNNVTLTLAGGW